MSDTKAFIPPWDSDWVDAHRRGICDVDWAVMNVEHGQRYYLGDVVEFIAGGFGTINSVSKAHDGWPFSYSTEDAPGMEQHHKRKCAWHYDGDIKWLVGNIREISEQDTP